MEVPAGSIPGPVGALVGSSPDLVEVPVGNNPAGPVGKTYL